MTEISHPNVPIETLRAWLTGDVIVPGDAALRRARARCSPRASTAGRRSIVRPVDAVEVAFVVVLAKLTGLAARGPQRRAQPPATA